MPRVDDFPADSLTELVPELVQAIENAERPGLEQGPRDAPLTELLSGTAPETLLPGVAAQRRPECLSGLWLLAGDLDRSHQISQGIENAEGSFWHAIMHRREGDLGNSKYWLRRTGSHPVFDQMAECAPDVYGTPDQFVDACGRAARAGGDAHRRCVEVQWVEWQTLMAHCLTR